MSTISDATSGNDQEALNSNKNKRRRLDINVSASRFKGVVANPNGHWGAQIYANHQRIWLGTFKSEKEAALAYDSAALIFRSADPHRNFPWTETTIQEPKFQSRFSKETLLCMIKDGSYPSKFMDFLNAQNENVEIDFRLSLTPVDASKGFSCKHQFHKELTPSDVGKLNRLVIPKQCALKYFPTISEDEDGRVSTMQLVFYDRLMRAWEFRYCYWKSSQSYVFTKGWNSFVKEKKLKEKDTVIFSTWESEGRTFSMIEVNYNDGVESNRVVVDNVNVDDGTRRMSWKNTDGQNDEGFGELKLGLGLGKFNVGDGRRQTSQLGERKNYDGRNDEEFEEVILGVGLGKINFGRVKRNVGVVDNVNVDDEMRGISKLGKRKNYDGRNDEEFEEVRLGLSLGNVNVYGEEEKKFVGTKSVDAERKGVRFFGVQLR